MLLIEGQHVLVSTNKVIIKGELLAVFLQNVVHCMHLGYELSVTFLAQQVWGIKISSQNAILMVENGLNSISLPFYFL